jgi:hypothetical protein
MFSQQQQEMEGNHKNLTPLKLFHGGNAGVRNRIQREICWHGSKHLNYSYFNVRLLKYAQHISC